MIRYCRWWFAVPILLAVKLSPGHDLITGDATERYLARASDYMQVIRSREAPERRGMASYELGRMLDEIRELLNRDIATHGKVQGLPSNILVAEFQTRGVALKRNGDSGRFSSPSLYFREAMRLVSGPEGSDAAFRWLRGEFYDAFDVDPLKPRGSWFQLEERMAIADQLARRIPPHVEAEEIEFIRIIQQAQAARMVGDPAQAKEFAAGARRGVGIFSRRYPDSLRNAALEALVGNPVSR
ncbi:MAG: hypothetical protein WCJ69_04035 [Betaproteobacteria bacterium]